jgi:hypothetical protein
VGARPYRQIHLCSDGSDGVDRSAFGFAIGCASHADNTRQQGTREHEHESVHEKESEKLGWLCKATAVLAQLGSEAV